MSVLLKSCPRCGGGDVEVVAEWGTMASTCIQCGYHRDAPAPKNSTRQYAPEWHGHGKRVLREMRARDKSRRIQ